MISKDKTDEDKKNEIRSRMLNVICVLVTICFMACLFGRFFDVSDREDTLYGYRVGVVLSDSMEPAIPTYSFILEREVLPGDKIKLGDIVSFYQEENSGKKIRITHRIVEEKDGWFYTKGDHNVSRDVAPLKQQDILSKVICIWPHLLKILSGFLGVTGGIILYRNSTKAQRKKTKPV